MRLALDEVACCLGAAEHEAAAVGSSSLRVVFCAACRQHSCMWSSRLFWKLFLAYAALIVLTVGACSGIVAGWQEDQLVEQVRRRLRDSATLLRDNVGGQLPTASGESLQQQVRSLGEQISTRFTLVDATGKVLADSEQPTLEAVAAMDNHLNRQEFVEANHSGSGASRRLSPTLHVPFLYHALSIQKDDQTVGFVRAAQPIASVLAEVASIRRLIWLAGLGVGLAGLLVTYWLTRRIVQPIQALTAAAEAMTAGNAPRRVNLSSSDELGTLARAFGHMVEKLSERESALRQSVDRHATVLSGMNEGVLAVDANQRVLFANVAAGNILGFVPDQAEEQTLLEVVRSNDLREIVQRALTTQQLVQGEIEWQADSQHTLDVNATPLPGDPCPGVVLVLHDITEIKRLEGLRQEFVANVSHELKTPLSSIKAYSETLLNGALEDRDNARRFLHRIDDQADRLHELILDMLSLARIESRQAAFELTNVSLSRVAGLCMTDYEARSTAAQITLNNEIAQSEITVKADEESLLQILGNLVDNALKYTPAGGTITLRCRQEEGDAVLEIADTGPGIDAIHHERLFERFYRVDKARSRELGGTGLGLAIVKHLSQAMGGSVSVQSVLGEGSVFRVLIPLVQAVPQDS